MKKIGYKISTLLFLACSICIASCKDGDIMVNKISVMQTEYDSEAKELVIRLKDNETLQLVPLIFPVDAANKDITFENENKAVMEVSATGLITGKTPGEDKLFIKATDGSGTVQYYKVYVKDHKIKASGIEFSEQDKELSIDTDATINIASKVKFTPDDVFDKSLTFHSSDENVAVIDANGIVTGISAGKATITVTTGDGTNLTATTQLTVRPDFYRANWKMELTFSSSAAIDFPNVIDGNITTFMNIPKPVRHAAGPPEGVPFGFIIDLGKVKTFNYFRLSHRNDQLGLRLRKLSLQGSTDGVDFTPIDPQGISIQYEPQSFLTIDDQMLDESTYRYVKIMCDEWDKNNNSVIQITEFYLGKK